MDTSDTSRGGIRYQTPKEGGYEKRIELRRAGFTLHYGTVSTISGEESPEGKTGNTPAYRSTICFPTATWCLGSGTGW
jgi:hypothetical protein